MDDGAESFGVPQVAVFGGGRWARVVAETLLDTLPASAQVLMVSRRSFRETSAWIGARALGTRVKVSMERPRLPHRTLVVIANAARDHMETARWALDNDLVALVEKPLASNLADCATLRKLARASGGELLAAHVFLFSSDFRRFVAIAKDKGRPISVHFRWADPAQEVRNDEVKTYDAGVPAHLDWLPHMLPMLAALGFEAPTLVACDFSRGGARQRLEFDSNGTSLVLELERNAAARVRWIEVEMAQVHLTFDFAAEPGRIALDGLDDAASQPVQGELRPMKQMLTAALSVADGGAVDGRFDPEIAQRTIATIQVVQQQYDRILSGWTAEKLRVFADDADLRYRLSEYLQADGRLSPVELSGRIADMVQNYGGEAGSRAWLKLAHRRIGSDL